jgi:hypothetical protein
MWDGYLYKKVSLTSAHCVDLVMRQLPTKIFNLWKAAVENVGVQLQSYYISQMINQEKISILGRFHPFYRP